MCDIRSIRELISAGRGSQLRPSTGPERRVPFHLFAQAAPPESRPLLWRLDPVLRAEVLMALLGLILLGLMLLILVRSWARWTRRQARQSLRPTQPGDDRWYKACLTPDEQPPQPFAAPSDPPGQKSGPADTSPDSAS